MDRSVNENFKFNQETEFVPILGIIERQLNAPSTPDDDDSDNDDKAVRRGPKAASSIQENHHPALLALISSELSVAPEEIHDFDL